MLTAPVLRSVMGCSCLTSEMKPWVQSHLLGGMSDMEDWQLQSIEDSTVPSACSEDVRQARVCLLWSVMGHSGCWILGEWNPLAPELDWSCEQPENVLMNNMIVATLQVCLQFRIFLAWLIYSYAESPLDRPNVLPRQEQLFQGSLLFAKGLVTKWDDYLLISIYVNHYSWQSYSCSIFTWCIVHITI